MNHDQLLEFIGSHGPIAGQLCLNLAGLLADRLLKENTVVSQVKMDLEEAITNLRTASEEDSLKTSALKELQGKVDGLNHATRARKEKQSKHSKFNSISMASLAVASLAIAGMFGMYHSFDHDAPERLVSMLEEVEGLKKNEAFYLELKQRLESENLVLVSENSALKERNEVILNDIQSTKDELSARDYEFDSLKTELSKTQEELAALISLQEEAQAEDLIAEVNPAELYVPLIPQEFLDEVRAWSQKNSTLAFPCEVKVVNEPVTLSDLTLSASVEIDVGKTVVITRFHPVSEVYAVARQGDSDTFMASVHLENTTIMEELAKKYVKHMKVLGKAVRNPCLLYTSDAADE